MIINSSELRAAGFKLRELLPPELEAAARAGARTASWRAWAQRDFCWTWMMTTSFHSDASDKFCIYMCNGMCIHVLCESMCMGNLRSEQLLCGSLKTAMKTHMFALSRTPPGYCPGPGS